MLGHKGRFTIGPASLGPDLTLPESFNSADGCSFSLLHEGGRLWFVDPALAASAPEPDGVAPRVTVEAGDRLTVRPGQAAAEILFAHCPGAAGPPGST